MTFCASFVWQGGVSSGQTDQNPSMQPEGAGGNRARRPLCPNRWSLPWLGWAGMLVSINTTLHVLVTPGQGLSTFWPLGLEPLIMQQKVHLIQVCLVLCEDSLYMCRLIETQATVSFILKIKSQFITYLLHITFYILFGTVCYSVTHSVAKAL